MQIALVVQENIFYSWQAYVLEELLKQKGCAVQLFETKLSHKHFTKSNTYKTIHRLERKLFKNKHNAFTIVPSPSTSNIDSLNSDIDLVINLTGETKLESISTEQWYFKNGSDNSMSHYPILNEIKNKRGEIEINLISFKEKEALLCNAITTNEEIPVSKSISKVFWKCAGLVIQEVEKRKASRNRILKELSLQKQVTKAPGIGIYLGYLKNLFMSHLRAKKTNNQWAIYYSRDTSMKYNFDSFQCIEPPKDRFWADPFYYKYGEQEFLFVEELFFNKNKGHLSVIELYKDGSYSEPVKILDKAYHLSYPFLIEEDGAIYMIPESKEAGNIQLYKAASFPYEWEFQKNIMEQIKAVDATVHKQDGYYWLYANLSKTKNYPVNDDLYLFYAKEIGGPWTSHPRNPIVQNCSTSRPAGRLFKLGNELYRPSQDGSYIYGRALNINKVETLTIEEYKETRVKHLEPNLEKGIVRNHTFNLYENFVLIDAMKKVKK